MVTKADTSIPTATVLVVVLLVLIGLYKGPLTEHRSISNEGLPESPPDLTRTSDSDFAATWQGQGSGYLTLYNDKYAGYHRLSVEGKEVLAVAIGSDRSFGDDVVSFRATIMHKYEAEKLARILALSGPRAVPDFATDDFANGAIASIVAEVISTDNEFDASEVTINYISEKVLERLSSVVDEPEFDEAIFERTSPGKVSGVRLSAAAVANSDETRVYVQLASDGGEISNSDVEVTYPGGTVTTKLVPGKANEIVLATVTAVPPSSVRVSWRGEVPSGTVFTPSNSEAGPDLISLEPAPVIRQLVVNVEAMPS